MPLELWLLAEASCSCYLLGPSIRLCFPGVTLYYLHKGPSNSCPLSFALPSAGLPRTTSLPHHSFSLWSLLLTHSAKILYTAPPVASGFHPPSQHATYGGCDWWLVVHPSLNLTSIPSKHFFFLSFFLPLYHLRLMSAHPA